MFPSRARRGVRDENRARGGGRSRSTVCRCGGGGGASGGGGETRGATGDDAGVGIGVAGGERGGEVSTGVREGFSREIAWERRRGRYDDVDTRGDAEIVRSVFHGGG